MNDLRSLWKNDYGFPGFGLQPSGSVGQNPDARAPSLYLELDNYNHPVACPHSATDSLEGISPRQDLHRLSGQCIGYLKVLLSACDCCSLKNIQKKGPPAGSQIEELLLKTVKADALTKVCTLQHCHLQLGS